jgi:hypothetical protein
MRIICSKCSKKSRFNVNRKTPFCCKKCGSFKYRVNKEKVCKCDAYIFPHRRGSGCCINNLFNFKFLQERYGDKYD